VIGVSRVTFGRLLGLLVSAVIVLSGCSGSDSSAPRPTSAGSQATETATPLEEVDTTSLVVPRTPFCDRIAPAAITRALGAEPTDAAAHRSGQRVRISADVADVVHEFGCRWSAGDNTAQAWVFAPPVTPQRAEAIVQALSRSTCREATKVPAFGEPSTSCSWQPAKGQQEVRIGGLFGDAWLTCSLTLAAADAPDVTGRASEWCAAVALGAASQS
jgi:hypothetical protein